MYGAYHDDNILENTRESQTQEQRHTLKTEGVEESYCDDRAGASEHTQSIVQRQDPALSSETEILIPMVLALNKQVEQLACTLDGLKTQFEGSRWADQSVNLLNEKLKDFEASISDLSTRVFDKQESEDARVLDKQESEDAQNQARTKIGNLERRLEDVSLELTDYKQRLKGNEVEKFIISMFPLYDRLVNFRDRLPLASRTQREAAKNLIGHLQGVMSAEGVRPYRTDGEEFNRDQQEIDGDPKHTSQENRDRMVADRVREGFKVDSESRERILRKETVKVYKYTGTGIGGPSDDAR